MLQIKRIYDSPGEGDGYRILVDRLWPRGIKKEEARLDAWAKEIAPSPELRTEFHHGMPGVDFRHYYREELSHNEAFPPWKVKISEKMREGDVTLLTAAKLLPGNHVEILRELLQE